MHWFVKNNMSAISKVLISIKSKVSKYYNSVLEYKRAELLQKNGLISLKNIVEILELNKIYYWIDAGTLLGILRDARFLDNDTDIDIAIVIDDPEHLYNILKENGYNIWYYYDDIESKKNLIRAEKHSVGIDFEIFIKENNKYFYDSPRSLPQSINTLSNNQKAIIRFEFDNEVIGNLVKYTFNNIEFNIPSNYDKYFATYYNNWKLKVQKDEYLDSYFSHSIEKYRHHNRKAYYKKDHFLYFHNVSPTTIKINFFDVLIFLIKGN